jgi:hypothetical protein
MPSDMGVGGGTSNIYTRNVTDHWSQVTTKYIVIMKNLGILWKLPEWDTETIKWAHAGKNDTNRLPWFRAPQNFSL